MRKKKTWIWAQFFICFGVQELFGTLVKKKEDRARSLVDGRFIQDDWVGFSLFELRLMRIEQLKGMKLLPVALLALSFLSEDGDRRAADSAGRSSTNYSKGLYATH
ncbi:disease resistance protein [Striga asiatica]|uniref:Disease resistance protein n=1 Tax=Striga asiatica TaxID=4170 RepID=A0A5A7Q057_STRAF|nr:disease resistance protein [Striga asiatica]